VHKTTNPKPLIPNKDLVFGHAFSDHMFEVDWQSDKGWINPQIKPYQPIALDPSASVFHYAFCCFEGMKAYKGSKGEIRLFRPDLNMARLNRSAERIALPTFENEQLVESIKQLIKIDERWIPSEKGYSLYLRPTLIGTQEFIGVAPSNRAKLFVIASPVGPYYKTGFKAVSLLATSSFIRAWPGGTGNAKIGGNYAPGIKPQIHAIGQNCAQNLWLFGPEEYLTEVGTMNCFVYWKNEAGEVELVTPPLDGTILPGVTRQSILELAKSWGEFKVSERAITIHDIRKALKEKRLLEMFGSGTACIVSPIKEIVHNNESLQIPLDPNDANSQAGPLTTKFNNTILSIQNGEIPSEWSVVVE
jgi:branched-chain amino acid aminotransferase